jgi:cell division protein FtsB
MEFWYPLSHRLRSLLAPAICALAVVYFGYHVIQGEKGLIAYARLVAEVERVEIGLAARQAEHERLAAKVALLGPDHIDPDMLDEQVRRYLGLAHPDEIVIFTN